MEDKDNFLENIGISVIIPAYNEEAHIIDELSEINNILKSQDVFYEIIVVDDGSSDGTWKEIKKLGFIKAIRHEENLGYGAAIKSGVRISKYEWILISDADGTYPTISIPELISNLGEYDMVVGARIGENIAIPLIRRPAKAFIGWLSSQLAGKHIPDVNSGLRIIKKSLVTQFNRILPDGFSFTTTITLACLTNGYKVKYIPINYKTRLGSSKIRPIHDTINFVQLIIRTVLYFNPLKIFFPLGLFFILISMILILYRIFIETKFVVFSIIFFSIGMNSLLIGMIADLIDKRMK